MRSSSSRWTWKWMHELKMSKEFIERNWHTVIKGCYQGKVLRRAFKESYEDSFLG